MIVTKGREMRSGPIERPGVSVARRISLFAGSMAFAAASVVSGSDAASASFTWGANSWGECNTSRPSAPTYGYMYFDKVESYGRPSTYRYSSCKYWAMSSRGYYQAFYRPVNWTRACALDANGRSFQVVVRSNLVYCITA